jgi:hypothetical protein
MNVANENPTMSVAVQIVFVRSCGECRRAAQRLAHAAIDDPSVTSIRIIAGRRHAHAENPGEPPMPIPVTDGSGRLFEDSRSDTNGFDPVI